MVCRGNPEKIDYDDAEYKFAVYSTPDEDEGGTALVFTRSLAWRASEHSRTSRTLGYGKAFRDRMTTKAPTQPQKATKKFRLISAVSRFLDTIPSIITLNERGRSTFIPLLLNGEIKN